MNHLGTQELRTKRLLLRRFTPEDAEEMFHHWAKDERVTRFLTWTPHASPEATKKVLSAWEKEYESLNYYQWGIVWEDKLIGAVSAVRVQEQSEWIELGYCLGTEYWNRGIMTEAVKAVIAFFFDSVGANRICIEHAVQNPASGRVAEKCGMTFEGTKREYFKGANGEFLDVSFWSILKRDWTPVTKERTVRASDGP